MLTYVHTLAIGHVMGRTRSDTHGKHRRTDPVLTREHRDGLWEVADPRIARQREDVPRIDDRAGGGQDALHRHARRAWGAELRLYAVVLEHRGRAPHLDQAVFRPVQRAEQG